MKLKIKLTKNGKFALNCGIMALLLCLRCINNLFIYPALIFGVIYILSCERNKCFPFLLFVLPFSSIYKFEPAQISMFTLLYGLYVLRTLPGRKFTHKFILLLIAFFVYSLAVSGFSQLTTIITMICGFLIINSVSGGDECDYKTAVYAYSAGIIAASVLAMFRYSLPILDYILWYDKNLNYGHISSHYRFNGLEGDPNYYSMYILAVLACLTVMILKERKNGVNLLLFSVLSVLGLLSVSKMFLLVWAALLIILLINSIKAGTKKFISVVLLFLIGGTLAYFFAGDAIDSYIFRFSGLKNESLSDLTTGRSAIRKTYLSAIFGSMKTMFLGEGLNSILPNYRYVSHDTYIQSWYSLGLIGSVIYILTLKNAIRLPQHIKRDIALNIPILILMVTMLGLGTISSDALPFLIALICLMKKHYREEDNLETETETEIESRPDMKYKTA